MKLLHSLAAFVGLPQETRNNLMAKWRRITHWLPDYYYPTNEYGLNKEIRETKITVSLTSYPQRIKNVSFAIETLLNQTYKPDRLILWLANEQFLKLEKDLPQNLIRLKQFGLSIKWCENLRSYKKLIPSLKMYPDDLIITADDDFFYQPDMLSKLLESYRHDQFNIHVFNAMKIPVSDDKIYMNYNQWKYVEKSGDLSYRNLILGGTGALYPPHSLSEEVFKQSVFEKITPNADDIWFWAMAVLNGRKIRCVSGGEGTFKPIFFTNNTLSLWSTNIKEINGNDDQFKNILQMYPLVKERLYSNI